MKENVVHATISEDVDNERARKEIQELIERGILKDAGYEHNPDVYD